MRTCRDIDFILDKLGCEVYKVDFMHDKVYLCGRSFCGEESSQSLCWSDYLEKHEERFTNGLYPAHRISSEALKRDMGEEEDPFPIELGDKKVRIFFDDADPDRPCAFIILQRKDERDLMSRIVDMYVYNNCDYFICLDAEQNSYTMLRNSEGSSLPAAFSSDYEAETIRCANNYVVEEDREAAIREMKIDRVLSQLDQNGIHTIYVGVMDPKRGYTRKKIEYRYYNKDEKMVLVSRIDITDIYLEEKQRNKELMDILKKASTDSLTGLLNFSTFRSYVSKALGQDIDCSALLFMDLDNFKRVNDTYGHLVGDALLREVSNVLWAETRKTDYVGRVGGDEFVVYLSHIRSKENAQRIAERICRRIESLTEIGGKRIEVSGSIGIAVAPDDGTEYEKLVKEADRRLYCAKAAGKNRTCGGE